MIPIIYQNHDHQFVIYSYPLFMGLAWGISYQIFFKFLPSSINKHLAQVLFWGIFLCSWIGAKLLFFQTANLKSSHLVETSFWLGGGFVFYGGLLGGALFIIAFKILVPQFNFKNFWPIIPALSAGHCVGRIGCFLAGCCYGEVTQMPWGIFINGAFRHPTQLIEASFLFLFYFYSIFLNKEKKNLLLHYLLSYGAIRLWVESLRGDVIRGAWGDLSPSIWLSLLLISSGFFIIFINQFRHLRKVE